MTIERDIIEQIRQHLDALSEVRNIGQLGNKQKDTKDVKTALCDAVRSAQTDPHGLSIHANGVTGNYVTSNEWLYDVTCLQHSRKAHTRKKNDELTRPLKRVLMVAECEWGKERSIYKDFKKLIVARAVVRVMVYRGKYLGDDNGFKILEEFIQKSDAWQAGGVYLLAACRDGKFKYKKIIRRRSRN